VEDVFVTVQESVSVTSYLMHMEFLFVGRRLFFYRARIVSVTSYLMHMEFLFVGGKLFCYP
jgi:hypothetical protein